MSKDITPEVGDIWEHNMGGIKINIESIAWEDKKTTQFNCLRCDELNCKTTGYIYQILPKGTIKKYYTYLGKSKASIEQLFEVEDNGRCVEDKTPHTESTVLFKDLENEE